jgi:8-oxo-dGTP pyrophosphatase MutT (NUDIX family)
MQIFNSFSKELEQKLLLSKLPGLPSQLKMAPVTRLEELKKMNLSLEEMGNIARKSAVLILFYPKNDETHIAMIKRATDNTVHSDQISFPGGKVEKSDTSLIYTALREAEEEIGIMADSVNIVGNLTKLHIPPSNFDVYPFIGITNNTPLFSTNYEVQKILEVDLKTLLNPATCTYKKIQHRTGNDFVVPCYYIQDEVVWGATAMIISELLEIVNGDS